MRIASVRVRRIAGRLPVEVSNSGARWTERQGLLLDLASEDGRIGHGDASPLPGYSTDTLQECEAALMALAGGPLGEIDLDFANAPSSVQVRGWLEAHPLPPAARFAAETALFDLIGRCSRRPMAELLGSPVAPHPVTIAALLPGDDARRAADDAVARGIKTLKIKVGRPGAFERECALLAELRRDLDDDIQLRLDANGAFEVEEARGRLAALAEVGPELIEEPVPLGQLAAFAERGLSPIALAADESLRDAALRAELLRAFGRGRVAVAVLKPTVLGGSLACLDLVAELLAYGAGFTVTHAFEGPIALAAAKALASVLPGPPMAAGLDRHPGLAIWPELEAA
jgi:o-succinylbenzoate synthase